MVLSGKQTGQVQVHNLLAGSVNKVSNADHINNECSMFRAYVTGNALENDIAHIMDPKG